MRLLPLLDAICLAVLVLISISANAFGIILRNQPATADDQQQWLRPVSLYSPAALTFGKPQSIKRMAEFGKRERIIMDALGGNDFLIKRSFGGADKALLK